MDTKKYKLVFSHLEMSIPKKFNTQVQKALNSLDIKSYHAQIFSADQSVTLHVGGNTLDRLLDAMTYMAEDKAEDKIAEDKNES